MAIYIAFITIKHLIFYYMVKCFFGPLKFETQFIAKAVYWVFIVSMVALTACGPKHESKKKKTPCIINKVCTYTVFNIRII